MLKVGKVYKVKLDENRWISVNRKLPNGNYIVNDITISKKGYFIDIEEFSEDILMAMVETEKAYEGIWRKNMLYGVWDGKNKSSLIVLNPFIIFS